MQLAMQKALTAPCVAQRVPRRSPAAIRVLPAIRRAVAVRRVEAAQEGTVEAADSATEQAMVPMADSLLERAKQVVDTQFVDEAFSETFVLELEAELATLRMQAEQAQADAAKLREALQDTKDKFVRLQADFENFRKRTVAEKESLRTAVRGDTVAELLPLVDNFELAKNQLKLETEGEKRVDAAYQGLYKQMVELFRGLGLEAVPGVGSPFDPKMHDGIMREANNDVPDGTVLEEFRKGFMIGDKLLRPAMVKVSFSESGAATPAASEGSTEDSSAGESDPVPSGSE